MRTIAVISLLNEKQGDFLWNDYIQQYIANTRLHDFVGRVALSSRWQYSRVAELYSKKGRVQSADLTSMVAYEVGEGEFGKPYQGLLLLVPRRIYLGKTPVIGVYTPGENFTLALSTWNLGNSGDMGRALDEEWYNRVAKTVVYLLGLAQGMKSCAQDKCIMNHAEYDSKKGLESFLKKLDEQTGFCEEHRKPQLLLPKPEPESKDNKEGQ